MTAFPDLAVPELVGPIVRLEPLAEHHAADLALAAAEDRSSFGLTVVPDGQHATLHMIRDLLTEPTIAFAQVRVADGRAVGCTRFLNLRFRPDAATPFAVEIGGTWLAASVQGTGLNKAAKLLLLTCAFETWGVGRVDLLTDARNVRSRSAIVSIGATFEGILRQSQPSRAGGEEALLRDSAVHSIVAADWPGVRDALRQRVTAAT